MTLSEFAEGKRIEGPFFYDPLFIMKVLFA